MNNTFCVRWFAGLEVICKYYSFLRGQETVKIGRQLNQISNLFLACWQKYINYLGNYLVNAKTIINLSVGESSE